MFVIHESCYSLKPNNQSMWVMVAFSILSCNCLTRFRSLYRRIAGCCKRIDSVFNLIFEQASPWNKLGTGLFLHIGISRNESREVVTTGPHTLETVIFYALNNRSRTDVGYTVPWWEHRLEMRLPKMVMVYETIGRIRVRNRFQCGIGSEKLLNFLGLEKGKFTKFLWKSIALFGRNCSIDV